MKTKDERKVNREIRKFNRTLNADVFKDRFWVRQYQKARVENISYFLFELIDKEQPERNTIVPTWCTIYDYQRKIYEAMNDFIIKSNFWSKYRENTRN